MSKTVFPPSNEFISKTLINKTMYEEMYEKSISDPDGFWGEVGHRVNWIKPYSKVKNVSYEFGKVNIKWYEDGTLNVAYNCVDRHLEKLSDKVAIIWEPDNPNDPALHITYRELYEKVNKFANVLKAMGTKKGDRVVIYMPMIPEATYAMLACARIGAIHSVVFAGFSSDALSARIIGCEASILITADEAPRGGKNTPLKNNADKALNLATTKTKMLVVRRTGGTVSMETGRDYWLHELEENESIECIPTEINAEDPLFILYTSGSTGQPKGVVHTSGGYLVYASMTHEYTFDYQGNDVFWCTADIGWITGHSYIVYGPLANGATTVMFEGVPNYPDPGRFWAICEKHAVNQFYTAPTAIRALMGQGNQWVKSYNLDKLRVLGTVGEPINPEAWKWYNEVIGQGTRPIVDTWWQTETGGHLITPLPGATPTKPGSATKPFFGIVPVILDPTTGQELSETSAEGILCIKDSWPGQMRTIYGDHQRFMKTYFSDYKGYYFTGDGCRRDQDGYYWITGRVDDVLNVSGHRMGTAEIESAIVAHPKVAESAVVGYPHSIKGQGIYAYVTLMNTEEPTEELKEELENWVRKEIGPIAKPDIIQWAPGLPKTRSGKIMRRILRKIAENDCDSLGDISTLADPSVVEDLIKNKVH
jgi:acetyl-CoA synthetase|tara:strand:- start:403 stop:2346 length:1944 start_codon:yes stop_codon:yes gene_type:complete